jgi:DNA polymerase-3 subunit delta'
MATLLHPRTRSQLKTAVSTRPGSYIFHGPAGVGKFRAASDLADELSCAPGDFLVLRPEDKPSILIEQVRALLPPLSLAITAPSGMRVVAIDDAQALTVEAQNALLKLIEEPPSRTVFILVTNQLESLLPTVRSRCQAIFFAPIPFNDLAAWLQSDQQVDEQQARQLAAIANGAPGHALTLAKDSTAAAGIAQLDQDASSLGNQNLFQRLQLARRLIDTKADLSRFGSLVQSHILKTATSDQMSALEQYRQALAAKVAQRVALEQLMVEL